MFGFLSVTLEKVKFAALIMTNIFGHKSKRKVEPSIAWVMELVDRLYEHAPTVRGERSTQKFWDFFCKSNMVEFRIFSVFFPFPHRRLQQLILLSRLLRSTVKAFLFRCCDSPGKLSGKVVKCSSKAALLASFSIFCARKEPAWLSPAPLLINWLLHFNYAVTHVYLLS